MVVAPIMENVEFSFSDKCGLGRKPCTASPLNRSSTTARKKQHPLIVEKRFAETKLQLDETYGSTYAACIVSAETEE